MEFKINEIFLLLFKCVVVLLSLLSVCFAIIGRLVSVIDKLHTSRARDRKRKADKTTVYKIYHNQRRGGDL